MKLVRLKNESRKIVNKKGKVFYKEMFAGVIEENEDGYKFIYSEDYVNSVHAKPISLIMPLTTDRKSTRLNSSHIPLSRMPSSA